MEEEKTVDEGQKVEEETIVDPEASEEEVVEEQKEPEPEPEKNWESEYKVLQSKKDSEVEKAKAETLRLQRLVSPYKKNIKETETGDLMFDFSESEKVKERVTKPDENIWVDDPEKATEQLIAFREQERDDRDLAKKEADKSAQGKKVFETDWNKSWERTKELYPDAEKEGSELQKKASEILAKSPELGSLSDCNEICFKLAASELNIVPAKETSSPKKKEGKDTSYIVSGGPGSKSKGKNKDESEEETPEEYISRRKKKSASKRLGVN